MFDQFDQGFNDNLYHLAAIIIRELVDILDDIVQEGRSLKIIMRILTGFVLYMKI